MLYFRSGIFAVGPESAGSQPGPTCYRKGGPLTITDANLLLGRIRPETFPHIFGPNEDLPLDVEATRAAFAEMTERVNTFLAKVELPCGGAVLTVADGRCADERGGRGDGVRARGQRGHVPSDPQHHPGAHSVVIAVSETLRRKATTRPSTCSPVSAAPVRSAAMCDVSRLTGAQHACAMARALGMSQIHIHRFASILSAFGIARADVVHERQEPSAAPLDPTTLAAVWTRIRALARLSIDHLLAQGFGEAQISGV